jgi:hypothetical protein
MNKTWTVERNTGTRAELVAEESSKQLWRPQDMSRLDFFEVLPPGGRVDEQTLRTTFQHERIERVCGGHLPMEGGESDRAGEEEQDAAFAVTPYH